jgi:hypothetical protein
MSEEQAAYEVEELTTIVSDTGRFAIVPEWVIDADLRPTSVRLYTVLSLMADRKTKTAHPSRRYLAKRCSCSIRAVADALAELKKVGAIKIQHRKEGKEFDTSIYTVIRAAPTTVALPRAPDNPPQAKSDTTLGYSNCTENQSHKPEPPVTDSSEEESSSSGRAEEEDLFLSDLKDFYADLPARLRSDLKVFDKYVEAVHENGEHYTQVDLRLCTGLANEISAAFEGYPGDWSLLTLPEPAPSYLNGLQEAAQAVRKHRPGKHALRNAIENLLLRDGGWQEPIESWPPVILRRIAQQPARFSEELIKAQQDAAKQVVG